MKVQALLLAASLVLQGLGALPGLDVAEAAEVEKPNVTIGVGGKPLLYYLPLTLAERLGSFKDEGLNVAINDFGGGAKSLQALIGGSVDGVTGAYEHTIRMQQKKQDIRAVIDLGRYPGIVLAVRKSEADKLKTVANLKGAKIGVTAPGSSTHILVQYAFAKAGLKSDDASFIGVGSGPSAVAAMQRGEIDAIAHLDPVISKLQDLGLIDVLIDTRTTEGTEQLFGGMNPAAVVYFKESFIKANPKTVQAFTNAFYRTLKWLETATPEEVAATVPEEYWLGDKDLYIKAFIASRESYSTDGAIDEASMKSALNLIATTDPSFNASSIDFSKTFDDSFLVKARDR
ncbi:ABC transporter substrate-binding protein [Kaistia geumhonensis]|uniref:NitT/TauT family transport system substrate-binding protein n=1 Tax=Kaistia geumhonensis TaxID=410839 RepID=A0ABU0M111_9HYPH|nr:ABC transporter substrate-binding protein [Kaistia geumhonensis]MCX5480127.1 ABC transporter substrate-binding protein [Kaistia geumhonensis]MDQ0514644.1 NitT/TauT family transport system substrate-binding protein [Kaistia geumhonensis]